ncbi:MAG: SixA phosphatase family protein [Chlorobiota bacterium]
MKRLYIVRHAKSDWNNDLKDFDRPLNERGNRDAPMMAKRINEMGHKPDIIISSSAKRAITTAKYFASEYDYPSDCIRQEEDIYNLGQRYILSLLTELPPTADSAMLFGHNPDLSYVSTLLSNTQIGNMPTCSVVAVEFDTDDWHEIRKAEPTLLFFEYPKKEQ